MELVQDVMKLFVSIWMIFCVIHLAFLPLYKLQYIANSRWMNKNVENQLNNNLQEKTEVLG